MVSSSCRCRLATFVCTALSSAIFSSSVACAAASCAFISASLAFFGPTSFATSEYTSIACTHMHRDVAALETRSTTLTAMSSIAVYFRTFFSIFGGMLSLSYVLSDSTKAFGSIMSFLPGAK